MFVENGVVGMGHHSFRERPAGLISHTLRQLIGECTATDFAGQFHGAECPWRSHYHSQVCGMILTAGLAIWVGIRPEAEMLFRRFVSDIRCRLNVELSFEKEQYWNPGLTGHRTYDSELIRQELKTPPFVYVPPHAFRRLSGRCGTSSETS